jgi:hypothetical protein
MPHAAVFSTRPLVAASVLLGQPGWTWAVGGLIFGAVILLTVLYSHAAWPARLRWTAGVLKGLGMALIAVCLLEPLWSITRARPGENLVLLVADVSESLSVQDGPGEKPRSEQFKEPLTNERSEWQVRLSQDFRVRRYAAAARTDAMQSFEAIEWDGTRSALGNSLTSLLRQYNGQPVAAVLLFTDGNSTDRLAAEAFAGGPPIYPVMPETVGGVRDVAIERTSVTQSSFEDAPVSIQVDVRTTDNVEGPLTARLLTADGKLVESAVAAVGEEPGPIPFRFQVRPTSPLSVYRVRVAEQGDDAWLEDDKAKSTEGTLENNERLIAVERDPGPYRVLYVSGRPNWEFKFLRRAVAEDRDVDLVGLIRMARREAKFEFLGREGESSNPLFRGFRKEGDEETESYDEPVVIALGVKDATELAGGKFPGAAEELFRYHAIVLDDVEAEFFTHDQQSLLERFVSQRGGGLLMLGGPQSFHHGGWHKTLLKDVLPVYFDRAQAAAPAWSNEDPPTQWRFQLTRDGWLQPWVRLRKNEAEEQRRLGEMSGFQVISKVNGIKPAAQVLASVVDPAGTRHPALVAHSYGDGRGAALLVGDMWRWSLRREEGAPDDLAKAWRQTVRWLVADVPQRIETSLDWTGAGASDAVTLRVRVRDKIYEPQENAGVQIEITAPEGDPLMLTAEPSLEKPGEFTATYVPRVAGAFTAKVSVQDGDGQRLGESAAGWTYEPLAEELRRIGVDRKLMEDLAHASGGEVLKSDELLDFAQSLPSRDVPLKEAVTSPLWHSPWVLALILCCLAGEWGLRRWKGLQ